jgi:hypothetical protein
MGNKIVYIKGPAKNEFHQDEKYFICNSHRRSRKEKKSDREGSAKVFHAHHRRHQTQAMSPGCCGVGPDGMPIKIHFERVSQKKVAQRKSKHRTSGEVYYVSRTMDAAYFEADLHRRGKKNRAAYRKLGRAGTRVVLQIGSEGGHGMARGHGVFDVLSKMMNDKYNSELVQQPGNTPMLNILDLTIWQACQLEVDKINKSKRQREPELVEVCKDAWENLPPVKIRQAFEMCKDCAQEAIDTDGWCPNEGKGLGGAARVHHDAAYSDLRKRLKIED